MVAQGGRDASPEGHVLRRIHESYGGLSPQLTKIADFVLSNFDEVIFMSVAELAARLGTSEAAIVRFSQSVGYSGFPDLRRELIEYYKKSITPAAKIDGYLEEIGQHNGISFARVIKQEIEYLEQSVGTVSEPAFRESVRGIAAAKHVFAYGAGPNEALANYLAFRLRRFRLRATPVTQTGKYLFESFLELSKPDFAVVYAFYQPSPDDSALLDYLHSKKIRHVLITDTNIPPMTRNAHNVLYARRGPFGVFHSLVVPMAVTNALVAGVAAELGERAREPLQELSKIRNRYYRQSYQSPGQGEPEEP